LVALRVVVKSVGSFEENKDYLCTLTQSERVRERRENVSGAPEVEDESRDLDEKRQRRSIDASKTVPDKTKKHASNFSTTKMKNKGHAKDETNFKNNNRT